jgi:hypothetical protein
MIWHFYLIRQKLHIWKHGAEYWSSACVAPRSI